jgi:hypothetical protein
MSVHQLHSRLAPISIAAAAVLTLGLVVFTGPVTAYAAEPGDDDFLGTAEEFAIIASDTITETDTNETVVIGDVALDPGTVVELLAVQVSGDIHISDTVSTIADGDLNTAYVILANTGATETVGTVNLAARVTPYLAGVYFSGSDLLLDGTITLFGEADDVFIFQASTGSLTVETGSVVLITGAAQACNVYWQVGSSATLGTDSTFVGTVLAATSIAALNGAEIEGQLLAGATNAGAVTLDNNIIDSGTACVRELSTATRGTGESAAGTTSVAELAETGWEAETPLILGVGSALVVLGSLLVVSSTRRQAREVSF